MNIYTNKMYDDAMWEQRKKRENDPNEMAKYLKENQKKECYKCGRVNNENNNFCTECGTKIKD